MPYTEKYTHVKEVCQIIQYYILLEHYDIVSCSDVSDEEPIHYFIHIF